MNVTIWHNPRCSKSRGALEILRERGIEAAVVDYLATPPTRAQLQSLVAALGLPLRELLRSKETVYAGLGLANPQLTDEQLFEALLANPVLLERPIVVAPRGARICRPPETVLEILPPVC